MTLAVEPETLLTFTALSRESFFRIHGGEESTQVDCSICGTTVPEPLIWVYETHVFCRRCKRADVERTKVLTKERRRL